MGIVFKLFFYPSQFPTVIVYFYFLSKSKCDIIETMDFKRIFTQLDISAQCRRYGLSLWQCPQFIFLVMGLIIIGTTIAAYAIGAHYIDNPAEVVLIVYGSAIVLLVIGFSIIQGFDRLAEANRMKSEFVSIVSHQLRSPLSNLKWAIEILMSGRLGKVDNKQVEYFRILKENSARMQELVGDLLIVSRIEQQRFPLNPKEFSLTSLARELIDEFEPYIKASNIEIKFLSQENLPKVLADKSRIKLVIENLLDNAIRYIKDNGVVEIKIEQKENSVRFEIKDNGVGIPEEDQKYIFQKFFRSENILRHQTQGTGLGLYIAKSIVEKSKGQMGFKSKEGKGSTFWFTLPIKQ